MPFKKKIYDFKNEKLLHAKFSPIGIPSVHHKHGALGNLLNSHVGGFMQSDCMQLSPVKAVHLWVTCETMFLTDG